MLSIVTDGAGWRMATNVVEFVSRVVGDAGSSHVRTADGCSHCPPPPRRRPTNKPADGAPCLRPDRTIETLGLPMTKVRHPIAPTDTPNPYP